MKLKELQALVNEQVNNGYGDADIRMLQEWRYNIVEINLTPNEYGEILIEGINHG